jgi:hypothetical protein
MSHNKQIQSKEELDKIYTEVKATKGINFDHVVSYEKFNEFIEEVRKRYEAKCNELHLPNIMFSDTIPRGADDILKKHISIQYNDLKTVISGLPETIPERLPRILTDLIFERASKDADDDPDATPTGSNFNRMLNRTSQRSNGLKHRRPNSSFNKQLLLSRNRIEPGRGARPSRQEPSENGELRGPPQAAAPLFSRPSSTSSQARPSSTPAPQPQASVRSSATTLQLDKSSNAGLEEVLLRSQRMEAQAQEFYAAQGQNAALQANAQRANQQNQLQSSSATARRLSAVREGVNALQEGQDTTIRLQDTALTSISEVKGLQVETLTAVGHVKELTVRAIERADEIIGISRDIRNTVGRVEVGVSQLRTMWAHDRAGLFRLAAHNEFVMFAVFFITHAHFPITTQVISQAWMAYIAVNRANMQVRGLLRGEYTIGIGSAINIITPWIVTATFFNYIIFLSDARVINDSAYATAFSTSAESAISAIIGNPQNLLDRLRISGSQISMPTISGLTSMISDAITSAGMAGTRVLEIFGEINPNWKDPAIFPRVLAQFLLGQLTVVIDGVSIIFASRAFRYQGLVAGRAFATVWQLITVYILEFIWSWIKYFLGGIWCILAAGLCSSLSTMFGYFINKDTCMTALGCSPKKEKMEGGALVVYSSPVSKKLDITIDKIMWTSILIEVNSILHPKFRSMNKKVLEKLYDTGGIIYELTLIPELGIGYEYRKSPLLFPEIKNNTLLLTNSNFFSKNSSRRNNRKRNNKTKRN